MKTKYIVITGGVISGLGKGVIAASLGRILQEQGYQVEMVKIDPYLNVDAGTMRPTEHGEVFVTYDGGETDQDLGTYERFLNKSLSREHNITNGQVYLQVIQNERNLQYDGKCVEIIPHISLEVKRRVETIARKKKADFMIVEIGGTVGDYQNAIFLETFRVMKLKQNNTIFLHIVYLPVPHNLGEMKTKPAQHSIRLLNQAGIQPDLLITRSQYPFDKVRKEKLSVFGNIKEEFIIESPDVENVYEVPLVLAKEKIAEKIFSKFGIKKKQKPLETYAKKIKKIKAIKKTVPIAIVGKYFDIGDYALLDSYISVIHALKHAGWSLGVKPKITWIDAKDYEKHPKKVKELMQYAGIIVPGGFGSSGIEGKIKAIQFAREKKIPYLGLCYGMQLAVIEFARNVAGMKHANSTEIDPKTPYPVIDILPEQKEKLAKRQYGNTMRLGDYPAVLVKGSLVARCYKKTKIVERHRHRYEVNPDFVSLLEKKGLFFSGKSPNRMLMEFMELPHHPFFVGTQAHPEFTSRFDRPNPLFQGFMKAALQQKT